MLGMETDETKTTAPIDSSVDMAADIQRALNESDREGSVVVAVTKSSDNEYEIVFTGPLPNSDPLPLIEAVQSPKPSLSTSTIDNQTQTLTFATDTSGTFKLRLGTDETKTTAPIDYSVDMAADIQAA